MLYILKVKERKQEISARLKIHLCTTINDRHCQLFKKNRVDINLPPGIFRAGLIMGLSESRMEKKSKKQQVLWEGKNHF